MYINPIVIGIVGTLLVEGGIITIACVLAVLTKGEKGENNNYQSNQ